MDIYEEMCVPVNKRMIVLVLLTLFIGTSCSDVEERRLEERRQYSIDHLTLTNPEMEEYIRAQLQTADVHSLREPVLLMARLSVHPDVPSLAEIEDIRELDESVDELSIVVLWMESIPSVDGVKMTSSTSTAVWSATMMPEQIEGNKHAAKREVSYGQSFRVAFDSEDGEMLRDVLKSDGVYAVLTRDGRVVTQPVNVTFRGQSFDGSVR